MVITLCDRFHKLPSEILNEDVELLRWLTIYTALKDDGDEERTPEPEGPLTIAG